MPVFEMPFAELERYEGTNPRPSDFDAYWDRALAELEQIDPQVEMAPHPTPATYAECFDLYFTSTGGARIHAKYLRPRDWAGTHPALLRFHGYGDYSGDWIDHLAYVAQGIAVAALDVRGQGGLSEDPGGTTGYTLEGQFIRGLLDDPDKLFFRQVYLDTVRLARIVMGLDEVDAERVGAGGASQGGALTIACSALEPRISRAAPVHPFLCDFKRVWEMDLTVDAYAELRTFFRTSDPRHEREEEIFTRLGYIDCQYLAPRIRADVLFATGLMDTVCPPSTQFAAYNRIKSPKELLLYPDFGHEDYPGLEDILFEFFSKL